MPIDSAPRGEAERLLEPIVTPKNFLIDGECRGAENAGVAGAIRRLFQQTLALCVPRTGDDRRR
jgi:hypothetical protein